MESINKSLMYRTFTPIKILKSLVFLIVFNYFQRDLNEFFLLCTFQHDILNRLGRFRAYIDYADYFFLLISVNERVLKVQRHLDSNGSIITELDRIASYNKCLVDLSGKCWLLETEETV